jgi:hypothetical protein
MKSTYGSNIYPIAAKNMCYSSGLYSIANGGSGTMILNIGRMSRIQSGVDVRFLNQRCISCIVWYGNSLAMTITIYVGAPQHSTNRTAIADCVT